MNKQTYRTDSPHKRQNLHKIFPCTMKTLVVRGVSLHFKRKKLILNVPIT